MSPRSFRPRPLALVAGLAFVGLALAVPVASSAQFLARETGLDPAILAQGVWIWKAATLLLGILGMVADGLRPGEVEASPLLERGQSAESPPNLRWNLGVLAICCAGLSLRFHDLGAGLWFDEIDTLVRYGNSSLAKAVASFETQNNHLGYSLFANLSVHAFGASAWTLRLPAVLLGGASLWALWRFALLVAPSVEAAFATALLAVSWHHVWFSQDARGYTGMFLAALIASGAFLSMLWSRRAAGMKLPLVYGLAASFAVWMHVTAVFVVVAHFLIWLWVAARAKQSGANRWPPLWGFLFAAALSLWCYALVLPQFVATLGGPSMPGHETQWRNPMWMVREMVSGLAAGVPGGWLAIAEGVFVLGLGLWSYARQSLAVLTVFLLPAALTCAVIVAQGHNLWPRFFFFSGGFAVLILLRGVFEFIGLCARGPLAPLRMTLSKAAATLLCLASAATLPRAFGPKQDFAAAAEYVGAHVPPQSVATLEMGSLPFRDYLGLYWTQIDDLQGLMDFERQHPETWVVLTMPMHLAATQPETWARLESEYREEKVFLGTVHGGEIVVKVRRAP
ncbi:MAG TPA: glycosyltransferase family 39 protein [Planctomycetota bacterium]|nr:glycosyltransferase family 39 protein [Planctomycetota bacterium]